MVETSPARTAAPLAPWRRLQPLAFILAAACAQPAGPGLPPAASDARPETAAPSAADTDGGSDSGVMRGPETRSSEHDTTAPLREMRAPPPPPGPPQEAPRPLPLPKGKKPPPSGQAPSPAPRDLLAPAPAPAAPAPAPLLNILGLGNSFPGFAVTAAPPDPNGDVGPNHYVQTVNAALAVFDKTGATRLGPVAVNTLWSPWAAEPPGTGKRLCAQNNRGDPIVLYDPIADRWLISQFAFNTTGNPPSPIAPFFQCAAVSTSPDPTGSHNIYVFGPYQVNGADAFNDYAKIGVWPDGYYVTYNMFDPTTATFLGAKVCAWEREKLLAGQTAGEQCFQLSNLFGGLLPADLDGKRAPPAGAPNVLVAFDVMPDVLQVWKFHVDWATPANSTLGGPVSMTVAPIALVCGGAFDASVPMLGTSTRLDTLGDRLMFRAAYRNLGGHESLVVNHTVDPGNGTAGVRWYELENTPGQTMASAGLVLQQQGTWAPDGNWRWMGSVAMDQVGNLALGYSDSAATANPSVRYAARLWNDAAGTIGLSETVLQAGAGSQTTSQGNPLTRWGDYSMMAVDPTDDCTFWYTNEYLQANGAFNWRTRIGSFKLPSCPPKYALSFPASVAAGVATSLIVTAQDNLGATLTSYVGPAAAASSDPQAVLPAPISFDSGVATAVPVTFQTTGTQTLTVTDSFDSTLTAAVQVQVNPPGTTPPAGSSGGCGCGSGGADLLGPLLLVGLVTRRFRPRRIRG